MLLMLGWIDLVPRLCAASGQSQPHSGSRRHPTSLLWLRGVTTGSSLFGIWVGRFLRGSPLCHSCYCIVVKIMPRGLVKVGLPAPLSVHPFCPDLVLKINCFRCQGFPLKFKDFLVDWNNGTVFVDSEGQYKLSMPTSPARVARLAANLSSRVAAVLKTPRGAAKAPVSICFVCVEGVSGR